MKVSLLMVLVAVLAQVKPGSSCGESSALISMSRNLGRIVGGVGVRDCSVIPWQARLEITFPDFPPVICGGSLISERHVLTAAHCIENIWHNNQVEVYLADHNQFAHNQFERKSAIKNVSMHHDYDPRYVDSDIAVLTLEEAVELNTPCMKRICMDPDFQFDGLTCIVSGWGDTTYYGTDSALLKMVKVDTHYGPKCDSVFNIPNKTYVSHPQKLICAGVKKGGKGPCHGDSGGPLVCFDKTAERFVQVGVVAYGEGCAWEGYPGMHTRVSYFQDWIDKVMSENNS